MLRKTCFLRVKSRISSSKTQAVVVYIEKKAEFRSYFQTKKIEVGENMIPFICGKLGEQKSILPSFPTKNVAILWIYPSAQ